MTSGWTATTSWWRKRDPAMTADRTLPEMQYYTVAGVSDFTPGRIRSVKVGLIDVVVLNLDGEWHAFSNYCTHSGAYLAFGWIKDGQVICPFHYACFDYRTGDLLSGPGYSTLPIFRIRIEGDDVQVELPI